MQFIWHRVKSRGSVASVEAIRRDVAEGDLWGIFFGLFGIGTNELFVVTCASGAAPELGDSEAYTVEASLRLEPTVRPLDTDRRTREGLYVFRFFEVAHEDVDEIAQLSNEAWTTFEDTSEYEAVPQALFAQADRSAPQGRMLLVTWYPGFNDWQISRQPHPDARENFRRRHQLMTSATPYATRLIPG